MPTKSLIPSNAEHRCHNHTAHISSRTQDMRQLTPTTLIEHDTEQCRAPIADHPFHTRASRTLRTARFRVAHGGQDSESRIPSRGFRVADSESRIPSRGFRVTDSESRIPSRGFRVADSESRIQIRWRPLHRRRCTSFRYRRPGSGSPVQDSDAGPAPAATRSMAMGGKLGGRRRERERGRGVSEREGKGGKRGRKPWLQ